MSKKYIRKIHFNEDEVWTYYTSGCVAIIFSPEKERFEVSCDDIYEGYSMKPSLIKEYIKSHLRDKENV